MKITRKSALRYIGGSLLFPGIASASTPLNVNNRSFVAKQIRHSVCRWPYPNLTLEELCKGAKETGLDSVELLNVDEINTANSYGLSCAIANGSPLHIEKGFVNPANHAQLLKDYRGLIPRVADTGTKNIICFSGNREGLSDAEGLENAAKGLEPVLKIAGKYDMTVSMELLNSTVDHPDYMCDHTDWGVRLVDKLGSSHFRLLYDIYHMQIMEGNIIATIQQYSRYFSHYHTGGVPGRNEIDETQELNYQAIVKAIYEKDYNGYVGQEFIPKNEDVFKSLKLAIEICDAD